MDESAIDTLVHTAGTLIMMQLAGYVAKSSGKILPKGEYGLGAFLSTIALPALLFRATATLDFGDADVAVLSACVLGKLVLFAISVGLARLTTKKTEGQGHARLMGGLFALLSTLSDDLGFGLPIFTALFPPGSDGARLVPLLFILSALQNLLFNPMAYTLLGMGLMQKKMDAEALIDAAPKATSEGGEASAGSTRPSRACSCAR